MTRNLKTITVGKHRALLNQPQWAEMLDYTIPGVFGLVPKERATWQVGRYFVRPAYEMWTYAADAFAATVPQVEAVHSNPDLNLQGKSRRAQDLIAPVFERLRELEAAMNEQITAMVETAPRVLVKPLAESDVVGFMQDQEIRTFLNASDRKARKGLFAEMVNGEHPALTSAALRAPSYVLAGFTEEEVKRLTNAGIAASHGDDVEFLDELRLAFDDARTAGLRVVTGLTEIIGPLEQWGELGRRINASFQPNEELDSFKQWLESIPRPPKRSERMIERSGTKAAA